MVYLDNAATTFPKPEAVYTAMDHTNRTLSVNAGRGAYDAAKKASGIIDDMEEPCMKRLEETGFEVLEIVRDDCWSAIAVKESSSAKLP